MGKTEVKNFNLEVGMVCNPSKAIARNPRATENSRKNSRPSGLGRIINRIKGKNTIRK
jgi:hypothetical protein